MGFVLILVLCESPIECKLRLTRLVPLLFGGYWGTELRYGPHHSSAGRCFARCLRGR